MWTVRFTCIPDHGASLAGMMSIAFHCHAARQRGFIGDVAVKFSKSPRAGMIISPPLLFARFLASLACASLADISQVLQADHAVWMRVHNPPTDEMVAVLFQPSLSSTDDHESSSSGTSAFLLQPFSESGVMVSLGSALSARIESRVILRGCRDCQVALSDVHTDHCQMLLRSWVCDLDFKTNKQVKLLMGLVIPQVGCANLCPMSNPHHMLVIACVGNNNPSLQRQDTDTLITLKTVVTLIVVSKRRRDIPGSLVKPLVAFLRSACVARSSIVVDLCPECLIGSPDLTGYVTSHLSGKGKLQAEISITLSLQGTLIAHLAMLKSVLAHVVQSIAVGQLGVAQCLKLFRCGS